MEKDAKEIAIIAWIAVVAISMEPVVMDVKQAINQTCVIRVCINYTYYSYYSFK